MSKDVVLALALCHNVTPVVELDGTITYQASSPDEVAIVRWTESVGAEPRRSRSHIHVLRASDGSTLHFDILEVFLHVRIETHGYRHSRARHRRNHVLPERR